jgi:hypothetical protein
MAAVTLGNPANHQQQQQARAPSHQLQQRLLARQPVQAAKQQAQRPARQQQQQVALQSMQQHLSPLQRILNLS